MTDMIYTSACAIAMVVALAAVVLEVACLREPKIPETDLSATGRRCIIAGLSLIVLRFGWLWFNDSAADLGVTLAVIAIAFGRLMRCAHELDMLRFAPHTERRRHHPGNS